MEKNLTPMNELALFLERQIDYSNNTEEQKFLGGVLAVINVSYLEHEKQVISEAYDNGGAFGEHKKGEDYYKENFKKIEDAR